MRIVLWQDSGRLIDVRTTGARRWEGNVPQAQAILDLLGNAGGTFDPSLADRRYRSLCAPQPGSVLLGTAIGSVLGSCTVLAVGRDGGG